VVNSHINKVKPFLLIDFGKALPMRLGVFATFVLGVILSILLAQVLPEPGLIALGAVCLAIAAGLVG
jgi:hypothetical protein